MDFHEEASSEGWTLKQDAEIRSRGESDGYEFRKEDVFKRPTKSFAERKTIIIIKKKKIQPW